MDLQHLITFQTVVATGSFSRAAAALSYVPSNVTAQIKALEAELGVPLFDRLGSHIRLTDAGQQLTQHAERILALVHETPLVVGGGDSLAGTVTISAPETITSYYLPAVLRRFAKECPHATVAFAQGSRGSASLRRTAHEGDVDVVFTLDVAVQAAGLQAEALFCEPVAVVAAPGHPLAAAVASAELVTEPLLLPDVGCSYRNEFQRILAEQGLSARRVLEVGSIEALRRFAIAGLGVALLPQSVVAAALASGELAQVAWQEQISIQAQMLWNRARWHSPTQRRFLQIARETIAQMRREPRGPSTQGR
ncbi:LysR family transcriptional regulator [Chloroflexia bacterium SDU3-3]|nr:LysR family transcriptional regulator [Chloroflexia bacterium SDU3-3]